MELEKEIFMRDGKLAEEVKVGAMLPMMTQEGFQIAGKVIDITADHVKMDFNHPFAGLTVRYEGEIEEVREATEEELKPVYGCGSCHGGGCHGGDCGGGDCHCDGDDCGCGEGSHKHDSGCCCK